MAKFVRDILIVIVFAGGIFTFFAESAPNAVIFGVLLATFAASCAGVVPLCMFLSTIMAFEKYVDDKGRNILQYYVPDWQAGWLAHVPSESPAAHHPGFISILLIIVVGTIVAQLLTRSLRSTA